MKHRTQEFDPDAVAEALDRLSDELTVLREVLDEIRSELQWANRNRDGGPWNPAPVHITSMPRDPTAPDWAERLNRYSAADLPTQDSDPHRCVSTVASVMAPRVAPRRDPSCRFSLSEQFAIARSTRNGESCPWITK